MSPLLLPLSLLVLLLGAGSLQDEPVDVRARQAEAMAAYKRRGATAQEREEAVDALLELGPEAAGLLGRQVVRELKAGAKDHDKARRELLAGYERLAGRIIEARLDREGIERLEAARAAVLTAARDSGLTKSTIQTVSDPAIAVLEELLVVRPAQVWDQDEGLFEDYVSLLDLIEVEVQRFAWFERCRASLLEADLERAAARLGEPQDPGSWEGGLIRALKDRAAAATPMSSKDRSTLAANEKLSGDLHPEEAAGMAELNRLRILLGIGVQSIDLKLVETCRDHSKDMATLGFFAHESPVEGKTTPWMRAARFGTSAGAENIAAGMTTGHAAIRAWWYSPGHHRNMLGGGARTGLGRHEAHWTQLFGG